MARRLCINYVSPAICEGDTSGSGFGVPIIVLEPLGSIPQAGGLVVAGEFPGPFFLDWVPVPGALCYNIYQVVGEELVLIFECVPQGPGGIILPPGSPGGGDTYIVTPITPEGEGSASEPVTTPSSPVSSFWNLEWAMTEFFPGDPAGVFTDTMLTDRFDFKGTQPGRSPIDGLNAFKKWEGSMIYTGPQRASHLSLEVSQVIGTGGQFFQLDFFRNGSPMFSVNALDLITPGNWDYDFDVPASAGDTISVTAYMVLGDESPTGNHWIGLLT